MATKYFQYQAGLGSVGQYQSSTRPFLSSSIEILASGAPVVKVSFPTVTKFITVKNTGPEDSDPAILRVGFSENGVNAVESNNYFVLENDESYSADWRVSAVYLRVDDAAGNNATASVIAGETGIDSMELEHNWTGSTGVG